MDLLLAFVLAMSVTVALIPLLARFAGRLQVLDAPNPRKVHSTPIPRVGGIAMFAGALVPMLYWLRDDPRLPAFVAAALLLVAVGVWDDRRELSHVPKFVGQLAAAVLVMLFGGVLVHSVMLGERVELSPLVAVPLTLVFLVGVTNAINLADGLDGLAGGTTLLSCCALALLGLTIDERFVATISVIVAGSILGFLRFNTYPARVFMGDGGSQFLGFTGAVLAILVTQSGPAALSTALPLLILGLPIIDTLAVMLQRISEGRSPFAADKNHIHHRLLTLGFEHFEAVFVIYLLQAMLFVAGWYLRYESDITILLTFAVFALAVLGALHAAARSGWRWRSVQVEPGVADAAAGPARWWMPLRRWLPQVSLTVAGTMASLFVLRTAWVAAPISSDIGWLAAIFAAALCIAAVPPISARMPPWWLHGALYVGAVVVVYLDVNAVQPLPVYIELAGLALLVGSVLLSFRLTQQRRFRLTPLDFLVVFIALALPNLPGSAATPRDLGFAAIKLIVLFYGIELLLTHSPRSKFLLQVAGIATFGLIGARALL
jgi:UDP-GlcNAc:undecaprenyl-phosphate GlcNAc-1-phosphate transferase